MEDKTLGFIGGGNMGAALLRGVLSAGLVTADRAVISDRNQEVLSALEAELGVETTGDNRVVAQRADVLVLAVKPGMVAGVLEHIAGVVQPHQLVVSVAAGVTIATLESLLSGDIPVIRTMPNTPCLVGVGASAYALGTHCDPVHGEMAEGILTAVGKAWAVSEQDLDAVTAVSGSGPAYLFYLLEGMIAGGTAVGLGETLARELALQTVIGAGSLASSSVVSPSELRARVTSPGGTTQAAIETLEAREVGEALVAAIKAARDRGEEIGRELAASTEKTP